MKTWSQFVEAYGQALCSTQFNESRTNFTISSTSHASSMQSQIHRKTPSRARVEQMLAHAIAASEKSEAAAWWRREIESIFNERLRGLDYSSSAAIELRACFVDMMNLLAKS